MRREILSLEGKLMKEKFRPTSTRPGSLAEKIKRPLQDFVDSEVSSGIVLLVCVVTALIWANSPVASSYTHFWETALIIRFGHFEFSKTLLHWINDGLMAIFFFSVGLEIKRELLVGELSSPRHAALPIAGALGGMILPAIIYAILNFGQPSASGWGVPMATDIAFSLGALALLSRYASLSVKVFLIALAIVDDLGAVLVITLFYSTGIQGGWLIIATLFLLLLLLINWLGLRHPLFYILSGIGLWYTVSQSGIHPTISGVILAATIPTRKNIRINDIIQYIKDIFHVIVRKILLKKCYDNIKSKKKKRRSWIVWQHRRRQRASSLKWSMPYNPGSLLAFCHSSHSRMLA